MFWLSRMTPPMRDRILIALQRGVPLCARPFEALARDAGCTEDEVFAVLAACRAEGTVRRFGAVFDTRRLGYTSVLCAVRVSRADMDAAAARLTPLPGVTHCYAREPRLTAGDGRGEMPNLWFTLSCPAEAFEASLEDVRTRVAPAALHVLPARRRYKVDVVFGGATRARDESVVDDLPPLTARERVVIGALQGDTPVRPDYFAALTRQINDHLPAADAFQEWDLLSCLEVWQRRGRLKRIGLLLAHREAGWTANGMCCWRIDGETFDAGRALAACETVTHCYERPPSPVFPYNLYAMIHARSLDEAAAQFSALEARCGLSGGTMLISTREYKKTSMTFFSPGGTVV